MTQFIHSKFKKAPTGLDAALEKKFGIDFRTYCQLEDHWVTKFESDDKTSKKVFIFIDGFESGANSALEIEPQPAK